MLNHDSRPLPWRFRGVLSSLFTLERIAEYQERYGTEHQPFVFIQIGANDGIMCDPLNEALESNNWTGIMVEPISHYCEQLRRRYKDRPGISVANVAISSDSGTKALYQIDPEIISRYYPNLDWLHGQGTFYRDVIVGELRRNCSKDFERLSQAIVTTEVECITFAELLRRYAVNKIDLLQIDAQGYDYEILKSVDFDVVRPAIINFESVFAKGRDECMKRLLSAGYRIVQTSGADTLVIDVRKKHLRRHLTLLRLVSVLRAVKNRIHPE
jgi:FkbM family methyltransferase